MEPIVIEHEYAASVDSVWQAITDPDQMREWFFTQIEEFKPEVGFETEFNVHVDGIDYLHLWKLIEVIPREKIVYNWRYGGIQGDSNVIWELSATDSGTRLKLTHETIEEFPQDNPVFSRESGIAGWTYFAGTLKEYVED